MHLNFWKIQRKKHWKIIFHHQEIGNEKDFSLKKSLLAKPIPYQINSAHIQFNSSNIIVYTIKNMESYNELIEMKSKQKYSKMFIASISHDFRTYINIISGNSEIISSSQSEK